MKVKSILILSALLLVSNLGLVSQTFAEVTAGAYFSTAPLVEPGIYDGVLGTNGQNGTAYYKFNALKGQTVTVSAVFTRARAMDTDQPGTCLDPAINAYDKNMVNLGSSVGKWYIGNYLRDFAVPDEKYAKGPLCIKGNDTTPHTLSGTYKVKTSGVNYVAVSTTWFEGDQYLSDKVKIQKYLTSVYYDLNITVEGTPDADAGTIPTVATTPVTTTPASTISGNGSMSVCQFIDLLTLLGVVDPTKAASVKVTMACK